MLKQDESFFNFFKPQFEKWLRASLENFFNEKVIYVGQEFKPVKQVMKSYDLSASSIRNYHHQGIISLRRALPEKRSRLFISVIELETHLRNNPLPRRAA
jgi:hypothetical protein